MSIVTIPTLSPIYPTKVYPSMTALDLAKEKFEQAQNYSGDAYQQAQAYLGVLSALFANAQMPETDIDYSFVEDALTTEIESKRPEAPTIAASEVNAPSLPDIAEVTAPTITVPSSDFGDVETDFSFDEPAYSSDLIDAVKTALKNYVENGGTGLGADVEDAIWERARARLEIVNERTYNEALEFFAARGFTMPPGALAGRLQEALQEQTRADEQINYEIMIEQARLAQNNTQHVLTTSVNLEGIEKQFANQIAQRAFEKARAAADVIINTYNAKVAAYVAYMEATRTEAMVEEIKANIQINNNRQKVEVFRAEVEKFKADLAQELGIVESVAKVYGFKVAGYEADAKVAVAVLEAQIKQYEGKITQATNQTNLSLKEAEMVLNSYLGSLALQERAAEGNANVAAQLAASAMNSVNASTHLGYSVGRQSSEHIGHSTGIGNNANLGETHSYQHPVS